LREYVDLNTITDSFTLLWVPCERRKYPLESVLFKKLYLVRTQSVLDEPWSAAYAPMQDEPEKKQLFSSPP